MLGDEAEIQMPPDGPLASEQIAAIARWIELGAAWPGDCRCSAQRSGPPTDEERRFWSFQPITDPPVPAVIDQGWPRTPIDRFILARASKPKA